MLSAIGRVFATGYVTGNLYRIDPGQPAGAVTTVATNLGSGATGIAYDGSRIWTANTNSVSIVTPGAALPWTVTTVTASVGSLGGAVYDGGNIWVTNQNTGAILKLDSAGAILQTVTVGSSPLFLVFDGSNIWVPNVNSSSVSVVRASNGSVLSTLTGNGLNVPLTAAFDGQRILVTNFASGADSVSLWKAADLTPLGTFPTGAGTRPYGACSDGINFWISLSTAGQLSRF
jgi:streptogramin lyase